METPETDEFETLRDAMTTRVHSDYFEALALCRKLEVERDEARKLAERYRNLSCDSQEEADETLLPWETNPEPNEL